METLQGYCMIKYGYKVNTNAGKTIAHVMYTLKLPLKC